MGFTIFHEFIMYGYNNKCHFTYYHKRYIVRVGEHDFTKKDSRRQQIRIELAEPHEEHDDILKRNDIAILHLYHDVDFNGKSLNCCEKMIWRQIY